MSLCFALLYNDSFNQFLSKTISQKLSNKFNLKINFSSININKLSLVDRNIVLKVNDFSLFKEQEGLTSSEISFHLDLFSNLIIDQINIKKLKIKYPINRLSGVLNHTILTSKVPNFKVKKIFVSEITLNENSIEDTQVQNLSSYRGNINFETLSNNVLLKNNHLLKMESKIDYSIPNKKLKIDFKVHSKFCDLKGDILSNSGKIRTKIDFKFFEAVKKLQDLTQIKSPFIELNDFSDHIEGELFVLSELHDKNWLDIKNNISFTLKTKVPMLFELDLIYKENKIYIENIESNFIDFAPSSKFKFLLNEELILGQVYIKNLKLEDFSKFISKEASGRVNVGTKFTLKSYKLEAFKLKAEMCDLCIKDSFDKSYFSHFIKQLKEFSIVQEIIQRNPDTFNQNKISEFIYIKKSIFSMQKGTNEYYEYGFKLYSCDFYSQINVEKFLMDIKKDNQNVNVECSSKSNILESSFFIQFEQKDYILKVQRLFGSINDMRFFMTKSLSIDINSKESFGRLIKFIVVNSKEQKQLVTLKVKREEYYNIILDLKLNDISGPLKEYGVCLQTLAVIDLKTYQFKIDTLYKYKILNANSENYNSLSDEYELEFHNIIDNEYFCLKSVLYLNSQIQTEAFIQIPIKIQNNPLLIEIDQSSPKYIFSIDIKNSLDLSIFVKKSRGILIGKIEFLGSIDNVQSYGRLEIQNFSYSDMINNVSYYSLKTIILGSGGNDLNLEEFVISNKEKSSLRGEGIVRLNKRFSFDINIKGKNFQVSHNNFYGKVDVELALRGDISSFNLVGNVSCIKVILDINRHNIYKNFPSLNIEYMNIKEQEVQETFVDFFPLNLDLNVYSQDKSLSIRGLGVSSLLVGKINIKNTLKNPHLYGELKLKNGIYQQYNKVFNIEKGSIILNGEISMSEIMLKGTMMLNQYEIFLNVIGRASNPKVSVSSTPALGQEEIFSYIFFGKSISDLNHRDQNLEISASIHSFVRASRDNKDDEYDNDSLFFRIVNKTVLHVTIPRFIYNDFFVPIKITYPIGKGFLLEYSNFNRNVSNFLYQNRFGIGINYLF